MKLQDGERRTALRAVKTPSEARWHYTDVRNQDWGYWVAVCGRLKWDEDGVLVASEPLIKTDRVCKDCHAVKEVVMPHMRDYKGHSPTPPDPDPPPTPGTTVKAYQGARIDGQAYVDWYGSNDASDGPWSIGIPLPNGSTALYESHSGKGVCTIHWGGSSGAWPPKAFDTGAADKCHNHGAINYYSFGVPTAGITAIINKTSTAAGYLDTLFTAIKNWGYPIIFRPYWEMNLPTRFDWGASNITPSEYLQLYKNTWQAAADVQSGNGTVWSNTGTHTGNMTFFWCSNVFTAGGSTPSPAAMWPSDGTNNTKYVDIAGWDGYVISGYTSPGGRYNLIHDTILGLPGIGNKPLFIGEMGVDAAVTSPGKAAWINDFLNNWMPAHPRVKGFSWFNEKGSSQQPHIELGDALGQKNGAALAAFKAGIASDYYGELPVLSSSWPTSGKVPFPA